MAAIAKSDAVYQLKIELVGIQPPIWRRVVTRDVTLSKLHSILQRAMGWSNSHLWVFEIGHDQYGESGLVKHGADTLSPDATSLGQIVDQGFRTFPYIYDFRDDWQHIVTVEEVLTADPTGNYPWCLAGERACPPEDCGGVWGYTDFLEALSDPQHESHQESLEMFDCVFDPEMFHHMTVNMYFEAKIGW